MIAYFVSGAVYEKLGIRVSFVCCFIIAASGSVLLIIFGKDYKTFVPYMVLGAKFGISGSFNVVTLANTLFPPIYSATTFGAFNFGARIFSMIAPPIAELEDPYPMSLFCLLALAAAFVSVFLNTDKNKQKMSFEAKRNLSTYSRSFG